MTQSVQDQKDIEFHSQSVNAWYATSLEYDRSILTLSAGATGWLVTLLTTKETNSLATLLLYIGALVCFVGAMGALLFVFRRNKNHIIKVLEGPCDDDPVLTWLDHSALILFGAGVLLSGIIGISTALSTFNGEKIMAKQPGEAEALAHVLNNPNLVRKSMNGAGALRRTAQSPALPPLPEAAPAHTALSSPVSQASNQAQNGSNAGQPNPGQTDAAADH